MEAKVDYKTTFKTLYLPPTTPVLVDVPPAIFVWIDGVGDPNKPDFQAAIETLYAFSYTVKMSYKSAQPPLGYTPYTVFPLEATWGLSDVSVPLSDKNNYSYRVMMRQPDFLTPELYQQFVAAVRQKKLPPRIDELQYGVLHQGQCCQMMHIGPYADEPASIARMEAFCGTQHVTRSSKLHHEIYLSDPRRTPPARLKTVLRFTVEPQ